MIRKTGPDLLRQTLTRLWFFNFYVQKPYNLGTQFIFIFKLLYFINIFLGCFRPLRKNTYIYQITHHIKKNTHRLIEISTYKFTTFRINYQNRNLNLYTNINSRKTMYPRKFQTFDFDQARDCENSQLLISLNRPSASSDDARSRRVQPAGAS